MDSQTTAPADPATAAAAVRLSYKGQTFTVKVAPAATTVKEFAARVASETGVSAEFMKLFGLKSARIRTTEDGELLVADHPVLAPALLREQDSTTTAVVTLRVVGSTAEDVARVQQVEDDVKAGRSTAPRVFDDLTAGAAGATRFRRPIRQQTGATKSEHGFQAIEVLGGFADAVDAQDLLERLALDPGIVAIMKKHKWTVGCLKEMFPRGKVGVSESCLMGLNVNAGQEIHLRIRTDDLQGFRKYLSIREVLCHELTHMVWGDHDNNFKKLNSQLLKEVVELDWTKKGGRRLGGRLQIAPPPPSSGRSGGRRGGGGGRAVAL